MATNCRSIRLAYMGAALFAVSLVMSTAQAAAPTLDELARDTERAESIRAVKNLQNAYSHYAQFGLWAELGALFASNGELIWGDQTFAGPAAITRYNMDTFGAGTTGLPAGAMNTLLVDVPLVNLSVDGNSAKARWYALHMRGGGAQARWEGGTYQNEYVKDNGVWKISRQRFYPQFGGLYEEGWRLNVSPVPQVPRHFASVEESGTPIPAPVGPAPRTTASLASLEQRIEALNAEDLVRNLQNAYGYYNDRKMWDDISDLFTSDGVLEIGGLGIYDGPANIRRALERSGPAGLKNGQLNDHPQFATTIEIAPGAMEAQARGIELGMLGDYATGKSYWTVSVFTNRFVKQDGVWKIREMRVYPVLKTDFQQGWGKSLIVVDASSAMGFPPNRPAPAAEVGGDARGNVIPAFLRHPVTGRDAAYPRGARVVASSRLLAALPAGRSMEPSGSVEQRLAEAQRRLAVSKGYDGALNLTASYSFNLDDGQWTSMGAIHAQNGAKQVPFNGFYIGPERIAHRPGARPAVNSTNSANGGWHWLMQPVIHVAPDGRSAKMRTRLFHPLPANGGGGGIQGGMYPNNQAILENGVWKLWSVTIDEPYFDGRFPNGWAGAPAASGRGAGAGAGAAGAGRGAGAGAAGAGRGAGAGAGAGAGGRGAGGGGAGRGGGGGAGAPAAPSLPANVIYPPNIPLAVLGRRMEGFVGGPGQSIAWPGILPMWFHYKNPVSGREPERYWPNCGTCEHTPATSMDRYGYLLPES